MTLRAIPGIRRGCSSFLKCAERVVRLRVSAQATGTQCPPARIAGRPPVQAHGSWGAPLLIEKPLDLLELLNVQQVLRGRLTLRFIKIK
jgi:hypothetical protein